MILHRWNVISGPWRFFCWPMKHAEKKVQRYILTLMRKLTATLEDLICFPTLTYINAILISRTKYLFIEVLEETQRRYLLCIWSKMKNDSSQHRCNRVSMWFQHVEQTAYFGREACDWSLTEEMMVDVISWSWFHEKSSGTLTELDCKSSQCFSDWLLWMNRDPHWVFYLTLYCHLVVDCHKTCLLAARCMFFVFFFSPI